MQLRTIGVVRSQVRERKQMAPLGLPARLEIFEEFAAGLLRIEKHSHLWVLVWLDRAERDVLQVTPRGVQDQEPEGLHGVFAVRSPVRPNPLGLTLTRVVRLEARWIDVDRLDFLDGTPVVDLKPYFPSRDLVFSAWSAPIGKPSSREAMRESLCMQAVNFHGELCADLALGVRLVEHFRSERLALGEPPAWNVEAPLARPCLVDALMGITRTSLGRGTLRLTAEPTVGLQDVRYELLQEAAGAPDQVWSAPDEVLFRASQRR